MKKILAITSALLAAVAVNAQTVLKVGATPEPHAEILNLVKDDLKAQGIDLQVIEFTDYVTPNDAVESGDIDANYFQHIPYLESFNKERGYHLVNAAGIHVEPFAVYSHKIKSLRYSKRCSCSYSKRPYKRSTRAFAPSGSRTYHFERRRRYRSNTSRC